MVGLALPQPHKKPGLRRRTFAQAIPSLAVGQHPAIPRTNDDLMPKDHIQAIANTAGFHFGTIEQGGTSLYPSLAQRVTNVEVLRVVLSIGPTEAMHFQTWQDKAGNAPPLTDPKDSTLVFPDLNKGAGFGGENFQTNLIMPEPTIFLSKDLPACSIVRPTGTDGAATAVVKFLKAMGLFIGQSKQFFEMLHRPKQSSSRDAVVTWRADADQARRNSHQVNRLRWPRPSASKRTPHMGISGDTVCHYRKRPAKRHHSTGPVQLGILNSSARVRAAQRGVLFNQFERAVIKGRGRRSSPPRPTI